MHIVHIKEEYESLSQAVKDREGVAALGFFFQVIFFVYHGQQMCYKSEKIVMIIYKYIRVNIYNMMILDHRFNNCK